MKTQALSLLFLFVILTFSSCKKKEINPEEVLPPATMEGKRTFGAMVNDQVWVPKGRPSTFQTNYQLVYDPGYRGGTLNIVAYRKIKDNPAEYAQLVLSMTDVTKEGLYAFDNAGKGGVSFYNGICEYFDSPDFYRQGTLEITKFDLENRIISGKFELTMALTGCDTIRITQGRFDWKL